MPEGLKQNNEIQKFYTPDELAELLSLSKSTVYRLIDKKLISTYKIGNNLRFAQQDVEEYLQKCFIKSFDRNI